MTIAGIRPRPAERTHRHLDRGCGRSRRDQREGDAERAQEHPEWFTER